MTTNLFFGELVTMHATIGRMCLNIDEKKKKMTSSMKENYDKYWDNIDNVNFFFAYYIGFRPEKYDKY